jgi:sugar O-acyltransferase (sialic acid O-acetyltransferase NeuD family)
MHDILFWGATGQAKVLHEALDPLAWRLVALVDNNPRVASPWPDIALLAGAVGLDAWLQRRGSAEQPAFAIAVGGGRGADRIELMEALIQRGLRPATLVHRTAFVAGNARIGAGCQILAKASVCAWARLGRGVIVNTSASVDHDDVLGDGVHIGPGATLAGEVTIEEHAFVGAGATVLPRVRIGARAIVGAGAVVTRDVPPGATVVGVPARPLTTSQ